MKSRIAVFIILCIILSITGCDGIPAGYNPDPSETFVEENLTPVPDASVEPEPDADPTPDPLSSGDISTMEKVFDALSFGMYENSTGYDPASPKFFWDTIYFMTSTILTEEQLVINDLEYMVFSEDAIRQTALVCFADLTDMPALPKNYEQIIFNAQDSVYYVAMSDWPINYTQTRMDTFSDKEGAFSAIVDLFDGFEDKVLSSYKFFLKINDNVSEDAPFFYRITGVEKL